MKQNLWNILINGLNKDLVVNKITANIKNMATDLNKKSVGFGSLDLSIR